MNQKIKNIIFEISHWMEIFVSIIISVVIFFLIFSLIKEILPFNGGGVELKNFTEFLSDALTLIVGVEFIRMLCKHTSETLIEVLLFAIARQMVVEHMDSVQTLIGVAAIVALFAARKFLFLGNGQSDREHREDEL